MTAESTGASRQAGQAAVEAALTLPMTVFLILGTLQLSMMLQARSIAHYAAFKSTRAGSVNFGDCQKMTDAAVVSLLPAFTSYLGPATPGGSPGAKLANAWALRASGANRNAYAGALDNGYNGSIVWIFREEPSALAVAGLPNGQDVEFDDPTRPLTAEPKRLEVRLLFWFPMRIPFANWVMSKMYLAYFGLATYTADNPLMPVQAKTNWTGSAPLAWGNYATQIITEFQSRNARKEYVFPIEASYTMRMMTPAKASKFTRQNCLPAP